MALFKVVNNQVQLEAASNVSSDVYGAGIRFTKDGSARTTNAAGTHFNQGIPMSETGQVAIVDATAGLPSDTIYINGLPISGNKVCVSRNPMSVISSGLPFDSNGALAGFLTLNLDFVSEPTLDPKITFTRASSATFTGSNGLIQTATTNTPRFDYNPVTLAANGLLIEEQRANLITYSEDFSNAAWAPVRSSVSSNATSAPDGNTTADKLVEDTSLGTHIVGRSTSIAITANTTYTASCFLKAAERTIAQCRMRLGGVNASAEINLTTGAVSAVTGEVPTSFSASAVGNGWYRVIVTATGDATATADINIRLCDAAGSNSYTGNGTSGIYIWGAQLEAGSFATSYIPTVASQVTRAADNASMLGDNFATWFNFSQGTFNATWDVGGVDTTVRRGVWGITDTGNQRLALRALDVAASQPIAAVGTGTSVVSLNGVAYSANIPVKVAVAYGSNMALSQNGAAAVTDSSTASIAGASFFIGNTSAGNNLNGHIRSISYYSARLPNATLQTLTS
jgi:hypothetical protein